MTGKKKCDNQEIKELGNRTKSTDDSDVGVSQDVEKNKKCIGHKQYIYK